jgi:hypothetical protein
MTGAAGFVHALVCPQVHLFVFDASPQTLDKYVVAPSTLAVHVDCYSPVGKGTGERRVHRMTKQRRPTNQPPRSLEDIGGDLSNAIQNHIDRHPCRSVECATLGNPFPQTCCARRFPRNIRRNLWRSSTNHLYLFGNEVFNFQNYIYTL